MTRDSSLRRAVSLNSRLTSADIRLNASARAFSSSRRFRKTRVSKSPCATRSAAQASLRTGRVSSRANSSASRSASSRLTPVMRRMEPRSCCRRATTLCSGWLTRITPRTGPSSGKVRATYSRSSFKVSLWRTARPSPCVMAPTISGRLPWLSMRGGSADESASTTPSGSTKVMRTSSRPPRILTSRSSRSRSPDSAIGPSSRPMVWQSDRSLADTLSRL